jgi:hypothetical protein
MLDFGWLGSASLWKSGPLFSTGTKAAELMVRELRVEPAVANGAIAGFRASDYAEEGERGVGTRLSTAFAEQDGRSSPGAGILFPNHGCAAGQGDMR